MLIDTDRVAEYEMKLMDIDTDTLGIPDTEYDCKVRMPSSEFARIVRELSQLGESVRIEVNKEGIRFNSEGDIANGSVLMKPTSSGDRSGKSKPLKNGSSSRVKVKKEKDADEEMEEDDAGSIKDGDDGGKPTKGSDDEDEEVQEVSDAEEEEESTKKRKRKASESSNKKSKKAKKDDDDDDEETEEVNIQVTQAVSLSFSLKYLINFSKSTGLCRNVELYLSADVPLLVSCSLLISLHFHS
jgi:proliferating cell nuclear antigen